MKSINTNITIRPVKISDVESLQKNIYSRDSLDQTREIINKSLEKTRLGTAFHLVAEVDGIVVGNIKVEFKQHVLERHRGELFDVVVNPRYQKKGIARLLFNKCKKLCLENGILILETSVRGRTPGETVYRRLGFIQYGRLPRGFKEPWDDEKIFDQIFFYMDLDKD
ncbi:GNAT family N-acetyltransferase [Patescibacteria group bacterium]|nr:GNAT family N-acetyltransferase [Patescibacteria group bacterium]MBU2035986.1 GNAT family N-acetyltransferase [Patescibacteria group bacterium]